MRLLKHIKNYFILFVFILANLNAKEEKLDRVFRVLTLLPEWSESSVSLNEIEGGLTNANYKAHVGSTNYFVRCGFHDNGPLGVSLDKEWNSASIASKAGLAPDTIFYSPQDKIFITGFIETQDRTVDLRNDESQTKFCELIRSLHGLDVKFCTEVCPFESIQDYIENAKAIGVDLPQELAAKVIPWMKQVKKEIFPQKKCVPCHFDLHHGNVLDDGKRLWLIDWEYAGMGDPFFDLATAASIENFTNEEMEKYLQTYLGRPPSKQEISYFLTMRILADVRWSLWCYLQTKVSPLDQPFGPYGEFYLKNAIERMGNVSPQSTFR